jgi:hypothetical protein
MVTVNKLIESLNNVGGTDCEITIQPLGFGRELLRVDVTMLSANDEHRVIKTLGQHISDIAPSQVSYGNVESGVRLNAVYFIPANSVSVNTSESDEVVAEDIADIVEQDEIVEKSTPAAKRKGR